MSSWLPKLLSWRSGSQHSMSSSMLDPRDPAAVSHKHAVVIGSGVAGVSTAYHLARRGFRVLVVDAGSGPSAECSAVAAGGMVRGNTLVDSTAWRNVFASLFAPAIAAIRGGSGHDDFPFFRLNPLTTLSCPQFLRWSVTFTASSLSPFPSQKTLDRQDVMLKFTHWSIGRLKEFLNDDSVGESNKGGRCGLNSGGALKISFSDVTEATTHNDAEPSRQLSAGEVAELEPWLGADPRGVKGGEFKFEAMAANSESFTHMMAELCVKQRSVAFAYNCKVNGMEVGETKNKTGETLRRVTAINTSRGSIPISPDTEVVVAAGSWTPNILWHGGVYCPIYPMKGYCMVTDLPPTKSPVRPDESQLPQRIVADEYVYVARLNNQIRIASVGEFDGWNTEPLPAISAKLKDKAFTLLPALAPLWDLSESSQSLPPAQLPRTEMRCGLRPFAADGILLLGPVTDGGFENLSVNVGPGFNGWKIAFGAGEVLAALLDRRAAGELSSLEGLSETWGFDASMLGCAERVKYSPLWCWLSRLRWNEN